MTGEEGRSGEGKNRPSGGGGKHKSQIMKYLNIKNIPSIFFSTTEGGFGQGKWEMVCKPRSEEVKG